MQCSDKIVKEPVKVDFHIHSIASKWIDGDKVKNNKIENLNILVEKLNYNKINMVSITDHNNFNYEIYSKLKEQENKDGSIKKVLPGVEFSVKFDKSDPKTVDNDLHIIAIFDDTNDNKVKDIQKYIFDTTTNKHKFNKFADLNCFSEEEFKKILVDIGIDFILISHQKNSLSSSNKKKHDTNNLNEWQDLRFIGFFNVLEFANPKNEIGNKCFIQNKSIPNVNFITGSDCHDWAKYPKEESNNFKFTYLKCLPSFKGIVMSLTNKERVRIGENSSFFNSHKNNINQIKIKVKDKLYPLELSKGINAIIGDNSVGKSLLLYKLNKFTCCPKDKQKRYEKYLKDNSITIDDISNEIRRRFDWQGAIRDIFENESKGIKSVDFIKKYLPIPENWKSIKDSFLKKIELFTEYLKDKKTLNEIKNDLNKNNIKFNPKMITQSVNSSSLKIIDNLNAIFEDIVKQLKELTDFKTDLKNLNEYNSKIIQSKFLNGKVKDRKKIENYSKFIDKLIEKYDKEVNKISLEKNKINIINDCLTTLNNTWSQTRTNIENARNSYNNSFLNLSQTIIKTIKKEWDLKLNIGNSEMDLDKNLQKCEHVGDYNFIVEPKGFLQIRDKDYLINLIKEPLKKTYSKKICNIESLNVIDPIRFKNNIAGCPDVNTLETALDLYMERINKTIDTDFKQEPFITFYGEKNNLNKLSLGKNSLIYFDLLSKTNDKKIYIVDQPEDDISQPSIKKLLKYLREIAKNRQILLVTHNPQLVVNLDVDNVIFIGKDDKTNETFIKYGALEYKNSNDTTNILDIVVDNMEGGRELLEERYKKYGTTN